MLRRILPLLLSTLTVAGAADLHLTPAGAGAKDGSSWENALPQEALAVAVNEKARPGDRLLIGSGNYKDVALQITASGRVGAPVTIIGMDRGKGLPIFESDWTIDRPDKGRTGIRLEDGASHLHFRNLRFRGYEVGIQARPMKEARGRIWSLTMWIWSRSGTGSISPIVMTGSSSGAI